MYKDKIEWRNYTRISDQSPRGRNRFYEGRHIKWPLYTCCLIHVKFPCSSQWLLYMSKSNHDTKSFSEPVSVTFVRGLEFRGRGDFQPVTWGCSTTLPSPKEEGMNLRYKLRWCTGESLWDKTTYTLIKRQYTKECSFSKILLSKQQHGNCYDDKLRELCRSNNISQR